NGTGGYTIRWLAAEAVVAIKGDFAASIPLYGFSFNFLGAEVKVGFNLDIDIAPQVALDILMMPATMNSTELSQGIDLTITQLIGVLSLPITVDVSFGIGIASVAVGGTIGVDVQFLVSPGPFELYQLWVNGSMFVKAQILFWSGMWSFVGPGIIYHWIAPVFAPRTGGAPGPVTYNNGSGVSWNLTSRYYNGSGYDRNVWSPAGTLGPAISDIYPSTQLAGASTPAGAFLFYTDDRVTQPVRAGLGISAARLDPNTNALSTIPGPVDPGFVTSQPEATALPDGSVYVLWNALPAADAASLSGPSSITNLPLHGAYYYPSNNSWGAVHDWTSSGDAQSYRVDDTGGAGEVAVLRTPGFLPSNTGAETLTIFNLSTGAQLSNLGVRDLSAIDGVHGVGGWAIVTDLGGNFSVLNTVNNGTHPFPCAPPTKASLLGASFVAGTGSTALLRYRSVNAGALQLCDVGTGVPVATIPTGGNVSDAHALYSGGTYYLLAAVGSHLVGWTVSGGTVRNLTVAGTPSMLRFGLLQAGASLLVYDLSQNGPRSAPTVTLELNELPGNLTPLTSSSPPSKGPGGSGSGSTSSTPPWALYLALAAIAVVLLLAVVALRARRGGASPPPAATSSPGESSPPPGAG
ncbi:MAG: hypothetical protein L3K04_08025, partial [Thermoplasmata archaeon]|nr:hypothetical protein [Thermoplasmata archaeon]